MNLIPFGNCCGMRILQDFPQNKLTLVQRAHFQIMVKMEEYTARHQHAGVVMVALNHRQHGGEQILRDAGYALLYGFPNPNSGNYVYIWMKDLTGKGRTYGYGSYFNTGQATKKPSIFGLEEEWVPVGEASNQVQPHGGSTGTSEGSSVLRQGASTGTQEGNLSVQPSLSAGLAQVVNFIPRSER